MTGALRGTALSLLGVALAACTAIPPTPPPMPISEVGPTPIVLTEADQALMRLDIADLPDDRRQPRCQVSGGGGGSNTGSSGGFVHRDWVLTCPRLGGDRNVYFLLADAIEANLNSIAASSGKGSQSGTAQEPISTYWDVTGGAYAGTVRTLGINGPGNLSIFVTLDLAAQ